MRWLILALVLTHIGGALAEPIQPSEIKVTDGDTIRARGERYRLVGYDTPETWSLRRWVPAAERNLAKKARKRFKQLLKSGSLDLTEVPCACTKTTTIDA
jgi:endonuclease YncB( thermonuclease family)